MNKQKNKEKRIALFEVILLVLGMFAFAYILGNSFEVVSASGGCVKDSTPCDSNNLGNLRCNGDIIEECQKDNSNPSIPKFIWGQTIGGNCFKNGGNTCENCQCVSEEEEEIPLADNDDNDEEEEKSGGGNAGQKVMQYGSGATTFLNLLDSGSNFADKLKGTKAGPSTGTTKTTLGGNKWVPENSNTVSEMAQYGPHDSNQDFSTLLNTNVESTNKGEFTGIFGGENTFWQGFSKILGVYATAFAAAHLYAMVFKMAGASGRNVGALTSAAWIIGASVGTAVSALMATGVIGTTAGATAGTGLFAIGSSSAWGIVGTTATIPGVGWIAAIIAIIAMAVYTLASYQTYSQDVFTYMVSLWQPSTGGQNCEDCNNLRYGCSEYQCHSFGQACEIVNNRTEYEKCAWLNPNDIKPPVITPMQSVLKSDDYEYRPLDVVNPGDRGVQIVYTKDNKGCIPPFTSLTLGINTSEPAECKLDLEKQASYDDMLTTFQEGAVKVYNHTLFIPSSAMPSNSSLQGLNWTIQDGLTQTFFARCKDANGNENEIDFIMSFCVQDGPDTSAPIIESTTYTNESGQSVFFQFNQTKVPLEVYTNEPADCRWDFLDFDYDRMNYNMSDCSQSISSFLYPSTFTYGCRTNLTGLKNNQNNVYYIKCKDQPWLTTQDLGKRNANRDPFILNLKGTLPLQIDNITINDLPNKSTIFDATDLIKATLKVKTSAGANEGNARCQYAVDGIYYDFYNDGTFEYTYENTQDLWLPEGDYIYPIRCNDQGGNLVYSSVEFRIDKDTDPPLVVRAFYEDGFFRLITNEESECVYSITKETACNYMFEDGTPINVLDNINHFLEWSTDSDLFIKCKDKFGNQPVPQNTCTIILRGSEDYSE